MQNIDTQIAPISSDLKAALVDIRQLIREELSGTLADVRQMLRDENNRVVPVAADFGKTATAARGALERLQTVLASFEGVVSPGTPLRYELANTLEEISAAARSIRILTQFIEQQPDTVIRGKAELRTTRGK